MSNGEFPCRPCRRDPGAGDDIEQFRFVYEGRCVLRGVLGDKPYPLVGLDTERSERRRAIRAREGSLANRVDDICDFLQLFMDDEGIEPPVLSRDSREPTPLEFPASYVEFASLWAAEEQANANSVGPDDAGVEDYAADNEVSAELAEAAQAIVGLDQRSGVHARCGSKP